ncbi:MAG: PAS domain S-box protein [Desulfobacula sp.]|nr:PAS domain S-box protein [Desulfobacula sp.]
MKKAWPLYRILLFVSFAIVAIAFPAALIMAHNTLRSVARYLPDPLILNRLSYVVDLLFILILIISLVMGVLFIHIQGLKDIEKRLRESLRQEKDLLKSLLETIPLGIMVWDQDNRLLYASRNFTEITGYDSTDTPSLRDWEIKAYPDPVYRESVSETLKKTTAVSDIPNEFKITCKTGNLKDVEFRTAFLAGSRWLFTLSDMADRKTGEEHLHYFKTAVEYSSDAIGMSDPNGNHWYQNKTFDELFGDIGKDPPASLYKNETTGRQIFKTIMDGGQWSGEVEMRGKDGAVLSILLRAYSIKDANGRVTGLVGAHTDITRQKTAEIALRKNEQLMRAILDANPDPMVMYDRAGIPQFMNPAFTEVFGWTLEDLQGGRIPFVPEDQKAHTFEKIKEIYVHGKPLRMNTRRYTKDNRTLDIFLSAAVTKDDTGLPAGMVVNLSDITQRKALEAQYEQAQKMESLGTLAGGIAHDFNNLLSGIYGYLDLAQKKNKDPKISDYLTRALNSSERAKNLTRQLLTFSKGGEPVKKIEPLTPFLQETTQFALSGSNVSCSFNIAPDLWTCDYDKNQMGQVIENIVINAVHAMPSGGSIDVTAMNVTIPENILSSLKPGRYVKISITDTGTGIPERYLSRIFDPFFTTKQKGSGLGLATSYSIVKRHGGIIEVESEPGRGTCFHAFIPAAAGPVTIEQAAPEKRYKSSGLILIMDDEEMITEMLTAMLESMGFTTSITRNGRQAVEAFKTLMDQNLPVRAIILDLTVPGAMGGKETVREIRKINAEVPVFVASGYSEDAAIANPEDFGFTAALEKPFSILDLSQMLEKHLGV